MAEAATYDNSAAVVLAILAIVAFVQLVGYTIFEYVIKIARPNSTVNFNKMAFILSGTSAGVFLLCISDSTEFFFPTQTFPSVIHFVGYCLFQSLYCYFLIIAGYPLLNKDSFHSFVQDSAAVAAVSSALQVVAIIIVAAKNPSFKQAYDVFKYTYYFTQAFVIFASFLYGILFVRRFYIKLRNPRGNEQDLSTRGLYTTILSILALIISLIASSAVDGRSILYIFSRFFMACLVGAMVYMKISYDDGLTKSVGGKFVYSKGYTISDTEEIEALTNMERPRLGVGAVA